MIFFCLQPLKQNEHVLAGKTTATTKSMQTTHYIANQVAGICQ